MTDSKDIKNKIFSRSITGVKTALDQGVLKDIVVLVGAGISTASGIPDYRSENGIYEQLRREGISNPATIFSVEQFNHDPKSYWLKSNNMIKLNAQPNESHSFLVWLHQKGILRKVYTQNIDGLELKAGLPSSKVVQLHGTVEKVICPGCNRSYKRDPSESIPTCIKCNVIMRPDVVFWGETVKMEGGFKSDFKKCDALFILGTSLSVYPCADFVNIPGLSTPRIIINKEQPEWPSRKGKKWNMFRFHHPIMIRDIMLLGNVENIVTELMN